MKPGEVILFIYDTKENFEKPVNQLRLGKDVFKDIILIENKNDFDKEINKLDDNQSFVLICHVFHQELDGIRHRGYLKFRGDGIEDTYDISAVFVSSGDSLDVYKEMFKTESEKRPIYTYSDILDEIRNGKIKPYTKSNVLKNVKFEFGIITALYNDEFEQIKKHFVWNEDESVINGRKKYWIGHLIDDPSRKVVASIPSATGMVDSAIIATQMLDMFKPKYLIMSGVCGATDDTNFGDIVLASKIFTFQKGKVSDIRDNEGNLIELFDKNNNKINYDQLYDANGSQIKVTVEKFEIEHDDIIEFKLKDFVEPHLRLINEKINQEETLTLQSKIIKIHFDGMACSTMVINKEGFFEDKIKIVDRKTVAVEMESYGVARACEFGNEGKTNWIIFKSVMDHTSKKGDTAKRLAAHTSGLFLKYLIYDGILK